MHCSQLIKPVLLLSVLCLAFCVRSQSIDNAMERIVEQEADEESVDEMIDEYLDAIQHRVSLNDSAAYIPEWLISPFQRELIRAYIIQHGYILSWEELHLVNGLDSATVALLQRYCTLEKPDVGPPSLKEMLKNGRHNIVTGSSVTLEQARGYKEKIYEGKPYRLYGRYRFSYKDYISFQFSAEKDAGEGFFYGTRKQGFDLYSGHILVSKIGRLKNAVIGRFRLQFGQGLTLWVGSRGFLGWNAAGMRHGRGICASSPFAEGDYMQGTAATVSLPYGFELTAFYSYSRRDATIDSIESVARTISSSGYHRSKSEIAKRGTLGEHLYGGNLQWNSKSFHLGLTAYRTLLDMPLRPKSYVYNTYVFRGTVNTNVGMDFSYRWRRLFFYGEGAVSQGGGLAGVVGVDCYINAGNVLSIVYRNYSANHYNLHASTWGRSSQPQNESGLRIAVQSRLPLRVGLLLQSDFYRHPYIRYGCYSPSFGTDLRTELSRQFTVNYASRQTISVRINHRYSLFMRNDSKAATNEYFVDTYHRHILYGDVSYQTGRYNFRTRVGYSSFRGDNGERKQGVVLLQDFAALFGGLSIGGRIALFDVGSYDARLYVAERGLEYDNGGTALYGKGMRFYFIARYTLKEFFTIALKYSVTAYVDSETIGSGYELIDSPHRQQLRLQVRFKW